jgi:hypothetical protein
MRARKALKLPRPKELTSNKLEAIQDHFRLWREEMDKQWRLLFQDVAVIQVDTDGWIYFGGKDAVGSARIGLDGTDWVCQHFIAGAYASRLGSSP